jgi:hypothetical protein
MIFYIITIRPGSKNAALGRFGFAAQSRSKFNNQRPCPPISVFGSLCQSA